MGVAARGAALATALMAGSPAIAQDLGPVSGDEEAMARARSIAGASDPPAAVEALGWNERYGAWCFRLRPRPRVTASPPPVLAALSRAGLWRSPSPACGPRPAVRRSETGSMRDFAEQVARNLAALQTYPLSALDRRAQGIVLIRVEVARPGGVLGACIVRGSGHADLDNQALYMAQNLTVPFFPPDRKDHVASLQVPIRFALLRGPASERGEQPIPLPAEEGPGRCGPPVS